MNTLKILPYYLLLLTLLFGCEELKFGDDFLEKPNSTDIPIDSVFAQKKYADQALNQFYHSLYDYQSSLRGYHAEGFTLESYTDLGFSEFVSWVQGIMTSSHGVTNFPFQLSNNEINGDPTYGIRKAYIYIENVDKVRDMTPQEKVIRKAEAKVIIGAHYAQMIRYYGGLPWIDHAYSPDEVFAFNRMTLEETVNKTVDLLDEAAVDLPWYTTDAEYGHMTAAVAKALKFRLLLFVASPLFNNVSPYSQGIAADARLSWYGDYQQIRWERALNAGRDFLRLNNQNGDYYRIENTGNPQVDYVNGYFVKGNKEVIMASFRWPIYKAYGAFNSYQTGRTIARGNYADMFEWKDGSKFDWNNPQHKAYPFFDRFGKPNRDVRMYETLLVNQDKWQGRKAEVYIGGREGYGTGSLVGKRTQFGYGFRKFVRDGKEEMLNKPYSCPLMRMPEIYLGMAEIMNQLGLTSQKDEFNRDAYDYLNLVRTRAGMPVLTSAKLPAGEQFKNYILDENAREFGQEEIRYFDIMRHKKGEWAARPMEMLEINKVGTTYQYNVSVRNDIKYVWKDYWYLLPFPVTEINKKYGLIQNPGW